MLSIRFVPKTGCLCFLAVVSGSVACGSSSAPPPTTPTSASVEDEEVTADLTDHHRHHHHGGVTMFIAMSLDSLGVSADRHAAIEKIQQGLAAQMEPARAAEQAVVTVLADGIAAGGIDHGKVDAALAQVAS